MGLNINNPTPYSVSETEGWQRICSYPWPQIIYIPLIFWMHSLSPMIPQSLIPLCHQILAWEIINLNWSKWGANSCSSLGLIPSIWFFMTWKFHKIKPSSFHIQHAIIRTGYKTLIALPIKKKGGRGTRETIQLLLWWCLVTQLCPTLCNPMGYSLSGSSI